MIRILTKILIYQNRIFIKHKIGMIFYKIYNQNIKKK